MTNIKIEKNISIPHKKGGRKCKYPWEDMEVGDSFLVKDANKNRWGNYNSFVAAVNIKYKPKKFTQRAVEDGLRVWRIK